MYSCCAFVFFSLPRGPILLEELWLVQTPAPQLVVFHQRLGNEGSGGTLLLFFKVLFSFHMMFVVFSFNRCLFFIQSMLSAAGFTVKAFAAYCCLLSFNCFDIHSICSKCPPLFHLIFTNLGILPITWGFLVRQDHRGTLWWGAPGISLVEMFWPIWKAQVIP